MQADNEFLLALANKLQKIANNTTDANTKSELNEFIDVINESVFQRNQIYKNWKV